MAIDNPAGRLHAILTTVSELEDDRMSFQAIWRTALGVEQGRLTREMAGVASLLADIERTVARMTDPGATAAYATHSPHWARAVFGPTAAWNAKIYPLVDPGALASLGVLSSLMAARGSEGGIPDDDVVDGLRESLTSALSEVRADASLPAKIKHVLVARLHDMLWAIDHLDVAGPDGVKAAAERLAAAYAVTEEVREHGLGKKVCALAGRVWAAFTFPGESHEAIEGWQALLQLPPA